LQIYNADDKKNCNKTRKVENGITNSRQAGCGKRQAVFLLLLIHLGMVTSKMDHTFRSDSLDIIPSPSEKVLASLKYEVIDECKR